jgi:hypothetical protein
MDNQRPIDCGEETNLNAIFPNPRFRCISDGLYYCEDKEVLKRLSEKLASGQYEFIPCRDLGRDRRDRK